jgi:methionyl-tRNA formyltransferase
MASPKIALFVAGSKGANFLRNFAAKKAVALVVSYESKGLRHDARAEIETICRTEGYRLVERKAVSSADYASVDLVLLAGWQWLTDEIDQRFVVFHDSLLPKLRGFNPTVTALIAGTTEIGVTAFSPVEGDAALPDSGPIFGQERIPVRYPLTVRAAYEQLGVAYGRLAERLIQAASLGPLTFTPQNAKDATYSLWRDEDDYQIDWASSAAQIRRFVDAVGWPYMGAKSTLKGRAIRIDRVETCHDLTFANRSPGKIWSVAGGIPEVVCGSGMLRIMEARESDGNPVKFKSLRGRFA